RSTLFPYTTLFRSRMRSNDSFSISSRASKPSEAIITSNPLRCRRRLSISRFRSLSSTTSSRPANCFIRSFLPGKILDFFKKSIKVDWLCFVLVAANLTCALTILCHGVRTKSYDRDVTGGFAGFKLSGRIPAVHYRQTHIHENDVGLHFNSFIKALQTVGCYSDFITEPSQASPEHVHVKLVIF